MTALSTGKSCTGTLVFSKSGIQIEVEYKRVLQATAYLANSLFEEWNYQPVKRNTQEDDEETDDSDESAEIDIDLSILNEVLSIYGSSGGWSGGRNKWRNNDDRGYDEDEPRGPLDRYFGSRNKKTTSLRMSYLGEGHPLRLLLAESAEGPTTVCQIHTLQSERRMELAFDDEDKIVKIIMKSSWLKDALSEIDSTCDYVSIICNPPQKITGTAKGRTAEAEVPIFRIEAKSIRGTVEMDYPNDREVLEFFECGQSMRFHYSFDVLHHAIRALAVSVKVSIRIDSEGVMSLQFLMPTGPSNERRTWMEFRCLAREDNL